MKILVKKITFFFFLSCFYIFLYQIYSPRVSAFGCFDDCFSYVAGYFLLKGKRLYSQIFFSHQPLMACLSYLIQRFTELINIYELVLRHRQFVFLSGFLMNLLLTWRFGLVGLAFAIFYEISKFYLFGDRFLAEGLIVYPLVYLAGLVWFKWGERRIYFFDYFLAAVFVWLVIFSRLPFVPLALLVFFLVIGEIGEIGGKKWPFLLFSGLVLVTLFFLPIRGYFFNVITVNWQTGRTAGFNLLESFFYPLYLFFGGERNIFRNLLVGLDVVFLLLFFLNWRWGKRKKPLMLMFLLLGLANLRAVDPGRVFYEAFHLLPWYGMFIFFTFLMLREAFCLKRKIGFLFLSFLVFWFFSFILSPHFFAREEVSAHEELINNFGKEMAVGGVVKVLSEPTDTLFLDGFDDLIYWQADRLSAYPYSWYTSVMPHIPQYSQARLEMFAYNAPDFYYGSCPGHEEVAFWNLPEEFKKDYQQLYSEGKPTCLHVRKEKIPEISEEKWQRAKEWFYERPSL